jgi:hypothetical protein
MTTRPGSNPNWLGSLYAAPAPIRRGCYADGTPIDGEDTLTAFQRRMVEEWESQQKSKSE